MLYTDGIPEAFDINKAQYGLKRLWQVVVENRHRRAGEIREAVINDVRQYIGAMKVFDDITLVAIEQRNRVQNPPSHSAVGGVPDGGNPPNRPKRALPLL